jgi:type I restriction enzyme, S subunit
MSNLHPYLLLDEIANFANGKALATSKYDEKGMFPVYGSNGIIAFSNEKRYDDGVTVIGRVGAYCGSLYFTNGPAWITDNAIVSTGKNGLENHFLYYLFRTLKLNRTAIGSAQPLLTQSGLKVIKVRVPPIEKRNAIQAILSALDDKIENNRKMNETLEEMARAIFKSWFVDFDPVHAKAAGNAPAHMDADTAALFPSSFGDDGLPMGWNEGLVSDIAHLNKATLKPSEFALEFIEHYSFPAFDEGKFPAIDFGGDVKSNKTIVPPNSVLLSKLNPNIERVWLPIFCTEHKAVSSTEFLVLTEKGIGRKSFLYVLFRSRAFAVRYEGLVTGTSKSHQRVRPQMLLDMNVVIPADELVKTFSEQVGGLFEKVISNQKENQTLATLRDTLLPKLMSGEIRMKDAERKVEAAV